MRVAVSGKGGSGKTTTAATLARIYARRGFRVNALDDDPNPNLATALGMSEEQVGLLRRVPREEIVEERMDLDGHLHVLLTKPFDEVVEQYAIRAPDDVAVLTMTGLLGAGQG